MMDEVDLSDPSLPLQELSLALLQTPPQQGEELFEHREDDCVRFEPETASVHFSQQQDSKINGADYSTWQVDGSYDSIASNRSTVGQAGGGLTMRHYEEQLNMLRKENFNLKLRIYFMEENKGILHGSTEQENLYRINIDLKVAGEELKKDLADKTELLGEAARAIQALEEKHKQQMSEMRDRAEHEREERQRAELRLADLDRPQEEGEVEKKGLSEESRILYNEAFGSFSLDNRSGDLKPADLTDVETKIVELRDELHAKSTIIDDLVAEKRDLEHKNHGLEREKLDLENTNHGLEKEKREHMEEVTALKDKNANFESRISSLEEDIVQSNEENDKFAEMIEEKEKEIQELKNDIKEAGKKTAELELARLDLEEQKTRLEIDLQELHEQENDSSSLVQENQELTNRLEEINARLHHIEEEKERESEDRMEQEEEIKKKEEERNDLLTQLVEEKRRLAEVTARLRETEETHLRDRTLLELCNTQVSRLESELKQRNLEVCSFLHLVKKLRLAKQRPGVTLPEINNDVIDLDEGVETASPDQEHDKNKDVSMVISESKALLEEILQEESSSCSCSTGSSAPEAGGQLEYAVQRNEELEKALVDTENELKKSVSVIKELQAQLQDQANLCQKQESLAATLETTDRNLRKAHICIQGFAKENQTLSKKLDLAEQANGRDKRALIQQGIDKGSAKFAATLSGYRARYDKLRNQYTQHRETVELLRQRMEQLASFLAQLLEEDDTLNASTLSIHLRESIQDSIEKSLLLSASIIQNNSVLEEEEEEEDKFDDIWTVPNVTIDESSDAISGIALDPVIGRDSSDVDIRPEVLLAAGSDTLDAAEDVEASCTSSEYSSLLKDLRDALRKRREAEEALQLKEVECASLRAQHTTPPSNEESQKPSKDQGSFDFVRPSTPPTEPTMEPITNTIDKHASIPIPLLSIAAGAHGQSSQFESRSRIPQLGRRGGGVVRSNSLPRPNLRTVPTGSDSCTEVQVKARNTRIPVPVIRLDDEEEAYSEPDKEVSRRRMGISVKESSQHSTRQTWFGDGSDDERAARERSRLEKVRKEKERLEAELKELEQVRVEREKLGAELEDLASNNSKLQSKVEKLQGNLDTAEGLVKELSAELKAVKDERRRSRKSSTSSRRSGVEGELGSEEETQNRFNELEVRRRGQSEAISGLKLQLQDSELRFANEKESLTRESQALERELSKQLNHKAAIEKELQSTKLELRKAVEQTEKKTKEDETATKRIAELNIEKTELGRTLTNLRTQVTKLEEKNLQSLEQELDQLRLCKADWENERLDLVLNVDKLEEQRAGLEQSRISLSSELREANRNLDSTRAKYTAEMNTLTYQLSVSQDARKKLEHAKIVQEKLNGELREEARLHSEDIEKLTDELHLLRSELSIKESLVSSFTADLESFRAKASSYAELQRQQDQLLQKNTGLEEQLLQKNIGLEEQLASIRNLREDLATRTRETQELTEQLRRSREEGLLLDTRLKSTESVLRSLTEEPEKENTAGSSTSHHEMELALSKPSLSRPGSRRALSSIDLNSKERLDEIMRGSNTNKGPRLNLGRFEDGQQILSRVHQKRFSLDKENPVRFSLDKENPAKFAWDNESHASSCCNAQQEDLRLARLERDAALQKLKSTQSALNQAADKISRSNKRKKKVEAAIVDQLTKTRTVLEQAQTNLESCSSN